MDIVGCQIISEPARTFEGWSSVVTRGGVIKGPFLTIHEAIDCARKWDASDSTGEEPPVANATDANSGESQSDTTLPLNQSDESPQAN